jgi:hypothetical protein
MRKKKHAMRDGAEALSDSDSAVLSWHMNGTTVLEEEGSLEI